MNKQTQCTMQSKSRLIQVYVDVLKRDALFK